MKNVPVLDVSKCTRCSTCISVCPVNAISVIYNSACAKCIKYCMVLPVPCMPDYLQFDYGRCSSCGLCVESCVQSAVTFMDVKRAENEKLKHL